MDLTSLALVISHWYHSPVTFPTGWPFSSTLLRLRCRTRLLAGINSLCTQGKIVVNYLEYTYAPSSTGTAIPWQQKLAAGTLAVSLPSH
jgi:hypothetical protein